MPLTEVTPILKRRIKSMTHKRYAGLSKGWFLVLVFFTPWFAKAQTVVPGQFDSAAQNSVEQHQDAVSLAKSVIEKHQQTKNRFESSLENVVSDNEQYTRDIQALSGSLSLLKPDEQALVLRAINCLTVDATASACALAIQQHETGELPDQDWIDALKESAELLPDRMNKLYLTALEKWESKYPFFPKSASPITFRPFLISYMGSSFHELASTSNSPLIASTAFEAWISNDANHWTQLESSALRNLSATNPKYRLYGIELFSRLNPSWTRNQSRLKQLTEDPDDSVARAATQLWLRNPQPNDHRRLMEALSADSDIEKVASLDRMDTDVTSDWGTIDPITQLAASGSANVRKAALRAISRTHPHIVGPFITAIEDDPEQSIRQFALDQVQLRGWYRPSSNRFDWNRNSDSDSYYALLANAGRAGLQIEPAMQKLTEPFGNHPRSLYDRLESGQLRENEKLKAIAQLLASDPSFQATETATAALRDLIANGLAKNKTGYLGQSLTAQDLIIRHAERLAPIVEDLCAFIEQTKSKRLVATLPSFGLQAKPALNLLIKILEDDSQTWRDSRCAAIFTIRKLQHHASPAASALLKVALEDDYSASLIAALTYLDLGGDPAALMPKYALQLPVLVKIDPAELVTIAKFKSELESAVLSDGAWNLIKWLGPDADFLIPVLKLKFKQMVPEPNSAHGDIDPLIELLPLLPSSQESFIPFCIDYIESEPRSMRCRMALQILAKIGDDHHLAENAVKSLLNSSHELTRNAAEACYKTLYGE